MKGIVTFHTELGDVGYHLVVFPSTTMARYGKPELLFQHLSSIVFGASHTTQHNDWRLSSIVILIRRSILRHASRAEYLSRRLTSVKENIATAAVARLINIYPRFFTSDYRIEAAVRTHICEQVWERGNEPEPLGRSNRRFSSGAQPP